MKSLRKFSVCLFILVANCAYAQKCESAFVIGSVLLVRDDQIAVVATRDTKLKNGDVVTTGSDGIGRFCAANEAKITVRGNSQVRIGQDDLALARGSVRINSERMLFQDRIKFRIRTRAAIVGFRGTDTIVSHSEDNNTTTVYTIVGSNSVASLGVFPPINTMANESVEVVGGQAPRLVPAPRAPVSSSPAPS